MEYVLGIDIGTGSTKVVAFGLDSVPLALATRHYQTNSPKLGYSEQDPDLIWTSFQQCLQEVIDKLSRPPKALCFSSAMHSLIPVNKKGDKLLDMMTWADCRSDEIATRLKESSQGMDIYLASGMALHAMSPLCKIIWIRENRPDIFDQTFKFISIKEYIWFKLFNEYTIDYSIASATGMLDISKPVWNKDLLQIAGIGEDKLSTLVDTNYAISSSRSDNILLGTEVSCIVGASDGCLANLGSFALSRGIAAVTIGTSGAVRIATDRPILDNFALTFSYRLDENTFICGGPVNNGGNVLQWLITNFLGKNFNDQSIQEVFRSVELVEPGSNGLIFLPYLQGERAPIWDAKSSGAFVGIRSIHTQAHFCRAALEGVCYALTEVLLAIENNSHTIDRIHVSGGFVNSNIWMQLLADISGKQIKQFPTEDASALGAAFMAIKGLGLNGGQYPTQPDEEKANTIEPDSIRHKLYKRDFLVFTSLYSGLKNSMHQLSQINS